MLHTFFFVEFIFFLMVNEIQKNVVSDDTKEERVIFFQEIK